jgi:putative phage-type endonuclease
MSEQGTDEWRIERAGKITASRFDDVLAMTKANKPTAAREAYMYELAAERISGKPNRSQSSRAMEHGTVSEDHAVAAYEALRGVFVERVGFVLHPKYDFIGASADGLVDADGGIEIKCPMGEKTHIKTWHTGMPVDHTAQVQGCMFVTGRAWWDFISFDVEQVAPFNLYIQRIPRDEAYIAALEVALVQFNAEVNQLVTEIRSKANA